MRKTFFATIVCVALLAVFMPATAISAVTAAGTVPAEITAIISDGTYNFLGTSNGKVYKQTVADSTISATLVGTVPGRITGLELSTTSLYITTSAGKIYYVASATTGRTDTSAAVDAAVISAGDVSNTEFDYLNGVTSAIQTQLNAKQATVTEGSLADGVIVSGDIKDATILTGDIALATILTGNIAASTILKSNMAAAAYAKTILDNTAGPTAAQSYDSVNIVNAPITVTLPTAVAGMSTCIHNISGSADDIIVDVQGADTIALLGAPDTAGDGITNATGSSLGDYACVVAYGAGTWTVLSTRGTWTQQ